MASSRPVIAAVAALLILATAAHARPLLTGEYCQSAAFKVLCEELLAKSGPMKSQIDTEAEFIRDAVVKVNEGMAAAQKLTGGGTLSNIIGECKNNYGDAVKNLNEGLAYLKGTGSDEDVNISLSSALTDIDSCNTEWGMAGYGTNHPLWAVNGEIIRRISNTLSLGNDLKDIDN